MLKRASDNDDNPVYKEILDDQDDAFKQSTSKVTLDSEGMDRNIFFNISSKSLYHLINTKKFIIKNRQPRNQGKCEVVYSTKRNVQWKHKSWVFLR